MNDTPGSTFVYVTFIRTTLAKAWEALTKQEFMKDYWCGRDFEAEWKEGGTWRLRAANGALLDSGTVVCWEPQKRIVLRWRHELHEDAKAEGYGECVFELEALPHAVKLTVMHSIDAPHSRLIALVSGGWPLILSNLKSLLETGQIACNA